jgi:hypothetical protein
VASRLGRIRAVPWLVLFQAAKAVHAHVLENLSAKERRRVREILTASRGNPMKVTPAQRGELRTLALKLAQRR